jgi:hypothetical protein
MGGSIIDKVKTKEVNDNAVVLAKETYDKEFLRNPDAFVAINENSSDERVRNIYRMLPQDMKDKIDEVWGDGGMFVHQEVFNHMFGQRRATVANLSMVDLQGKTVIGKLVGGVNNMLTLMLNNRLGIALERGWQDFIKIVKDTIVIRSIHILGGNMLSNSLVLAAAGVPLSKIIPLQIEGYKLGREYMQNEKELSQLEMMMKIDPTGAGSSQANKNKVRRLKHKLATSPVRDLMEAGVFQSINEDIYTLEDDTVFKSKLDHIIEPYADKIPLKDSRIIKEATMQHGSTTYTALKDLTQFSDFMARYALHKHNTASKSAGGKAMSVEESINDIVETFINYDAPTNRFLQYGNDMGFVLFTKYYIRIQRVIFKSLKERPASAALIIALQSITGFGLTDIYDSHIGNTPYLNTPVDNITGLLENHPLIYGLRSLFS